MISKVRSIRNIALIAHDDKKQELCIWVQKNKHLLVTRRLFATDTTGRILECVVDLKIDKFASGPLGGNLQIGARISEAKIDLLVFFWDPFESLPHDSDVKALFRIAAVCNIPVASNAASADFIISSPLFDGENYNDVVDREIAISVEA